MRLLSIVLFSFIGLVGCATVPMGDPAQDAALKNFSAKPGVAGLYVYRNESLGAIAKMTVTIDKKIVGQTAANTYLYNEVPPGKHVIGSVAENTDTLEVSTVAGKLYFIWQEVKMGVWAPRTKLHLMSEEEGKKGVLETKLAAPQ